MADPFESPNALLARAAHHINELESEIIRFGREGRRTPFTERDAPTGDILFKLRFDDRVTHLPCIVFDAVSCLRSSLDHVVYGAAALITALPEPGGTKFPFGDNAKQARNDFVRKGPPPGLDPLQDFIIDKIQPYQGGGGEALWRLNKARNTKIHRILAPVAIRQKGSLVTGRGVHMTNARPVHHWDSEKQELTHYRVTTFEGEPEFNLTLGIAFVEGSNLPKGTVVAGLRELAAEVAKAVADVASEAGKIAR